MRAGSFRFFVEVKKEIHKYVGYGFQYSRSKFDVDAIPVTHIHS